MGAEFTVGTLEEMCDNVVPEKLCDTCIYRNNVEQLKPCIIYRDDCEYYKKERDMTKGEKIAELINIRDNFNYTLAPREVFDDAIKALEQEPNTWSLDDAREDFMQDVYNTLDFLPTNEEANRIIDSFDRVTSNIEQEPKTGHWIAHPEIETSTPEYLMFYECSECGDKQCFCKTDIHKKRFCTNCGAKMVEPQESEVNNG